MLYTKNSFECWLKELGYLHSELMIDIYMDLNAQSSSCEILSVRETARRMERKILQH